MSDSLLQVLAQPLVIPRRLAILILHAAQIAQPRSIRGIVTARSGEPAGFREEGDMLHRDEVPWARMWSYPQAAAVPAAAVPAAAELDASLPNLVVSLNTKGVLEMRAWRLVADQAREQVLKIRD
jgi:[CysO sulfur-carrier protein]-S-L-cysteine hydrolase